MVRAWHGRGRASVNQTRPHCVNQTGKTHSKPLVARHGRGTAWARYAMCESTLIVLHCMNVGRLMIGKRYGGRVKGTVWWIGCGGGSKVVILQCLR
jgi:hypothetical protein